MNKTWKRIAVFMIFTLLAPVWVSFIPSIQNLSVKEAYAATAKAKLVIKNVTVGVNSSPEYIYIENNNASAKYTYVSANKKVAVVNEYGGINGIAKGSTKVTVQEKLKGVVKNLGTVNVKVVDAALPKTLNVGLNSENYIFINYRNYEAEYKYKSANTKIAKVDQYGTVTGAAKGKTTVSVTSTYKGKTTKVGSLTINVIGPKISKKELEVAVSSYGSISVPIDYMNPKAVYKFTSANQKIAKIDQYGYIIGVKKGSTTISVSETYNKKTTKLGSIKVKVVGASVSPEAASIDIGVNLSYNLTDKILLKNMNWDHVYTCKSADESIVTADYETNEWGDRAFKIKGVALGKTTLTIYEEANGDKVKIGTVKVVVKEYPVTAMEFADYCFEQKDGVLTKEYYVGNDYSMDSLKYYISIEPYETTTPITYSSSDENVITVDSNGIVTVIGEGTATITAECGEFSSEFQAVVKTYEE